MLSFTTKTNLANIIQGIGLGEQELEICRSNLSRHPYFEIRSVYQRIDRRNLKYLAPNDILQFFLTNNIHRKYSECLSIVRYFDSNKTGFIEFNEFSDMILPKQDIPLHKLVSSRMTYYVDVDEFLDFEIELAIIRLFEQIIQNVKEYDNLRRNLQQELDYSVNACFNTIDKDRVGYLDLRNIYEFLLLNKYTIQEKVIIAFIQYADGNHDQKIEYFEFAEMVLPGAMPVGGSPIKLAPNFVLSPSKRFTAQRVVIPTQSGVQSVYQSQEKSNTIDDLRQYSKKQREQYSSKKISYNTYLRESNQKISSIQSPSQSNAQQPYSQIWNSFDEQKVISPLRGNEEQYLMGMLKKIIEIDRDVQNIKIELSLREDFNLKDCFQFFDVNHNQTLTQLEFQKGVNQLSLFPTQNQIFLFFENFDEDKDGLLEFKDFQSIFSTPNKSSFESQFNKITLQTQQILKHLFNSIFEAEKTIDNFKQELNQRSLFNIYDAFRTLDLNNDGQISYEELKEMLRCYGIFTCENDMQTLMKRFDKDRDGTIKYAEFAKEMIPKSPKRD